MPNQRLLAVAREQQQRCTLDFNIGRPIDYLKRTHQYDDNGAEGGSGFASQDTNDNSLENLGRRYSNLAHGQPIRALRYARQRLGVDRLAQRGTHRRAINLRCTWAFARSAPDREPHGVRSSTLGCELSSSQATAPPANSAIGNTIRSQPAHAEPPALARNAPNTRTSAMPNA
jgi:hypothetical protein